MYQYFWAAFLDTGNFDNILDFDACGQVSSIDVENGTKVLSRDSSRRQRGKTDTILPYLNWQYQAVKQVTVRKECGSRRGDQVFVLSDLRSPDIGRGKREKPNDWLGPQSGSGAPFPSAEVNKKKLSFWAGFIAGRRTIAILLRAEDKKINWDMRDPSPSSQY